MASFKKTTQKKRSLSSSSSSSSSKSQSQKAPSHVEPPKKKTRTTQRKNNKKRKTNSPTSSPTETRKKRRTKKSSNAEEEASPRHIKAPAQRFSQRIILQRIEFEPTHAYSWTSFKGGEEDVTSDAITTTGQGDQCMIVSTKLIATKGIKTISGFLDKQFESGKVAVLNDEENRLVDKYAEAILQLVQDEINPDFDKEEFKQFICRIYPKGGFQMGGGEELTAADNNNTKKTWDSKSAYSDLMSILTFIYGIICICIALNKLYMMYQQYSFYLSDTRLDLTALNLEIVQTLKNKSILNVVSNVRATLFDCAGVVIPKISQLVFRKGLTYAMTAGEECSIKMARDTEIFPSSGMSFGSSLSASAAEVPSIADVNSIEGFFNYASKLFSYGVETVVETVAKPSANIASTLITAKETERYQTCLGNVMKRLKEEDDRLILDQVDLVYSNVQILQKGIACVSLAVPYFMMSVLPRIKSAFSSTAAASVPAIASSVVQPTLSLPVEEMPQPVPQKPVIAVEEEQPQPQPIPFFKEPVTERVKEVGIEPGLEMKGKPYKSVLPRNKNPFRR